MRSILLLLALTPTIAFAQDTIRIDGKISYEFIDSAHKLSKSQVFDKVKIWLASTYGNIRIAEKSEDKEGGTIMAKGRMSIYMGKGAFRGDNSSDFTIQLTCRDEKIRMRIYDFKFNGEYPIEIIASLVQSKPKSAKDYQDYFTWISINSKELHSKLQYIVSSKDDF